MIMPIDQKGNNGYTAQQNTYYNRVRHLVDIKGKWNIK